MKNQSLRRDKVLDSWALLAYFEGQTGGEKVLEILKEISDKGGDLFISVVNWGEILYVIESRHGMEKMARMERLMDQMPLQVMDVNKELAREAAHLKATSKLPYGDSFAAALAILRKAELVTGDKDFRSVENKVHILWLE